MASLLGDHHVRSVLWLFATAGPVIGICLLALCCWRPTRRPAIGVLLISSIAAAAVTVWFHFAYVMPKWKGHSSAIWMLDRAAFSAGFAIAACGGGIAGLIYYVCRPRK
jgi:hypothetical protein